MQLINPSALISKVHHVICGNASTMTDTMAVLGEDKKASNCTVENYVSNSTVSN